MDDDAPDPWNDLAVTVTLARTELGIGQDTAAERAGIGRRTWQRIEAAENPPQDSTLVRVAKVVDLDPEHLLSLAQTARRLERQRDLSTRWGKRTAELPDPVLAALDTLVNAVADAVDASTGDGHP